MCIMAADERAAASARLPGPMALTAKAWSAAVSAPSTSLKAAALMTHCGVIRSTVRNTASGPVLDEVLERRWLSQQLEHRIRHLDSAGIGAGPEVVGLARLAFPQHPGNSIDVIVDVEVLAHRRPVAVDRKRQVLECIGDEERNDLLRELIRPVGVRPA